MTSCEVDAWDIFLSRYLVREYPIMYEYDHLHLFSRNFTTTPVGVKCLQLTGIDTLVNPASVEYDFPFLANILTVKVLP